MCHGQFFQSVCSAVALQRQGCVRSCRRIVLNVIIGESMCGTGLKDSAAPLRADAHHYKISKRFLELGLVQLNVAIPATFPR